ncbi:hypothetical protein D9M69_595350 [compost metagenome]
MPPVGLADEPEFQAPHARGAVVDRGAAVLEGDRAEFPAQQFPGQHDQHIAQQAVRADDGRLVAPDLAKQAEEGNGQHHAELGGRFDNGQRARHLGVGNGVFPIA